MTDESVGIPSLETLDELADRILEHAVAELDPERTTLEVTGYADGDYRIEAYETISIRIDPDRDEEIWERVAIRYDRRREWIQRRHYQEIGGEETTVEVRDLEAYPDPVAMAESEGE
ncbi:hypothetical protein CHINAEXTREME_18310 [Halobiforma lacisalsi AJ5]|uniref:Uncharacterized protein n=1 Tax=Natronobacterium lacisalsi AJ5 TaxID=358396 RepID=M0LT99_NATLA|nr:hypothetical protein [Halobiforma lacisalsi]APW99602.1 hypothetical protein CHINAEXTREME_18310 [Halobiforma lacisalsi AJ5]EMA35614.1 hypothetical protein C445_05258 [Halobiforma lacisalsi AJ5]